MLPLVPWTPVMWQPTVRVISREFAAAHVFANVTDSSDTAAIVALVADLTNPATAAGASRYLTLPSEDRITVPNAGLILGPFCFGTAPTRFSDGSFGVWYGASRDTTAAAERCYHTTRALNAGGIGAVALEMAVVHATLDGMLADIRGRTSDLAVLYDPVSYSAAQTFGADQRTRGAQGIVYDSVRDTGGECAAVLRPRVLHTPIVVQHVIWHWDGAQLATH